MTREKKIKIIVAKPGLDGHDRGAKLLARIFAEAGMEVVYTGLRQTPEMIVNTAIQEDADVVGLSSLSGVHNYFFPRVVELLRERGSTMFSWWGAESFRWRTTSFAEVGGSRHFWTWDSHKPDRGFH